MKITISGEHQYQEDARLEIEVDNISGRVSLTITPEGLVGPVHFDGKELKLALAVLVESE